MQPRAIRDSRALVTRLCERLLDTLDYPIQISSFGVYDGNTHVTDSEVLVLDILVQTGRYDDIFAGCLESIYQGQVEKTDCEERTRVAWEGYPVL